MKKQLLSTLAASVLMISASVVQAQDAPSRTECIAPAKPGGGFDLTCKLIQVSMLETGAIAKPIGSQDWMKAALLAQQAKVDPHKMRYVAFEGGGEPVTALMGNHVQAVSGDLSEMVPYLNGDKIRVLAVFSENRLPGQLANVPTAKEQGYDLVWPIIRGFFVGPKVTDAEYQWWVETFNKLQQTDAFKKQRDLRGLFEFNLSGKPLDEYVKKQVNDYREQAKAFGLAK